MSKKHTPVLLDEVITALSPKPGKSIIDATFGFGGHSYELERRGAKILGIEQDKETIEQVAEEAKRKNIVLVQANFIDIYDVARAYEFDSVDGILFDLGYSSWQLDESGRGITYSKNEPLDMRLDTRLSITAKDVVNTYSVDELAFVLSRFGEESSAKDIAQEIVDRRPVTTTAELVDCIEACTKINERVHKARVFQALRIVVNNELDALKEVLPKATQLLKKNGVLCVISFHSLEDRIVKQFIKKEKTLREKPVVRPTMTELKRNRRATSALLRIAEKI